ncbi:MAG TPA: Hsp20/alpha crystallin family protein [Gemmatimonadaceae bacterium]|nr:Hsp20/alpha crystallin family protein [Gemmatimonadaceae bacterium]
MALARFTRRQPRVTTLAPSNFQPFEDFESRMNRIFGRALANPVGDAAQVLGWIPATDIVETPEELTLTAELPGMGDKDVDISVQDGVLTICGEKTEERKDDGGDGDGDGDRKVYLYERSYGSFQRSFSLPSSVDGSKITADFDKGVLKVHMPKTVEAKAKGRKIEVNITK